MNTQLTTVQSAIATLLNVSTAQVTRIEEWAYVWFAVIAGKGGRFVSKRRVAELVNIPVTDLPDPWEQPVTLTANRTPARAVIEPAYALLLPPARDSAQLDLQAVTAVQLRKLCDTAGIKWNRASRGGKHLTKAEMIQRLTA